MENDRTFEYFARFNRARFIRECSEETRKTVKLAPSPFDTTQRISPLESE